MITIQQQAYSHHTVTSTSVYQCQRNDAINNKPRTLMPLNSSQEANFVFKRWNYPKFEGSLMPNDKKYQKSVQSKFRHCLEVSQFAISLLITRMLVEETAFKIWHFHTFQTSTTLSLYQVIQHTVVYHSLTSTDKPNFVQIDKTSCGWMGTETDFINEQCVQQWQLTFVAAAVAECAADILDSVDNNTRQIIEATRKPCCRKETARCRKCSFLLKFANNIHYKYKTSEASKAATLKSSKHADA